MMPLSGLTNIVYWTDVSGVPSVVRQGRPFAALLGINRRREAEILRQIQHLGIGPEILSMDPQRDQTVFRAIPGVSLNECATQPTILARSLTVLSCLHSQPASGMPFSASSLIRHYLAISPLPPALREFCEHQASLSAQMEWSAELTLCHNDCVAKNWILKPDGDLNLIDFEFAAPNDPAFDLATWCLAFSVHPEDSILHAYDRWEPQLPLRVCAYMPVVDTLWSLYCRFMFSRLSGEVRATALLQMKTRVSRMDRVRSAADSPPVTPSAWYSPEVAAEGSALSVIGC